MKKLNFILIFGLLFFYSCDKSTLKKCATQLEYTINDQRVPSSCDFFGVPGPEDLDLLATVDLNEELKFQFDNKNIGESKELKIMLGNKRLLRNKDLTYELDKTGLFSLQVCLKKDCLIKYILVLDNKNKKKKKKYKKAKEKTNDVDVNSFTNTPKDEYNDYSNNNEEVIDEVPQENKTENEEYANNEESVEIQVNDNEKEEKEEVIEIEEVKPIEKVSENKNVNLVKNHYSYIGNSIKNKCEGNNWISDKTIKYEISTDLDLELIKFYVIAENYGAITIELYSVETNETETIDSYDIIPNKLGSEVNVSELGITLKSGLKYILTVSIQGDLKLNNAAICNSKRFSNNHMNFRSISDENVVFNLKYKY